MGNSTNSVTPYDCARVPGNPLTMPMRFLNCSFPRCASRSAILLLLLFSLGWGSLSRAAECVAPPTSLTHWWRGNSTAAEEVGGRAAILEAGAGYGGGMVGDGFYFESGSLVRLPDEESLRFQSFTFEAWIYAFDAGTHPDSAGGIIISKDINLAPSISYALAGPGNTGKFVATVGLQSGGAASVTSAGTYGFHTWYHLTRLRLRPTRRVAVWGDASVRGASSVRGRASWIFRRGFFDAGNPGGPAGRA